MRLAHCRQGRLRQLQGAASVEEVKDLEQQLERAFEAEQSAAEFFVSEDLRIRVRVPRPLGTPLENLSEGATGNAVSDPACLAAI